MAERAGFEPAVPLRVRRLSKPVLSATQPPLREVRGRPYSTAGKAGGAGAADPPRPPEQGNRGGCGRVRGRVKPRRWRRRQGARGTGVRSRAMTSESDAGMPAPHPDEGAPRRRRRGSRGGRGRSRGDDANAPSDLPPVGDLASATPGEPSLFDAPAPDPSPERDITPEEDHDAPPLEEPVSGAEVAAARLLQHGGTRRRARAGGGHALRRVPAAQEPDPRHRGGGLHRAHRGAAPAHPAGALGQERGRALAHRHRQDRRLRDPRAGAAARSAPTTRPWARRAAPCA